MHKSAKILIIRAGPTGLTAALHLATNSYNPVIVEKRKHSSTLSRAVGVMPESLVKLGKNVANKIMKEGMPFLKINIHVDKNIAMTLDFTDKLKSDEVIIGLPQDRTEEIIKEELQSLGVKVNYNKEVTEIKNNEESVIVSFKDFAVDETYDWVIACDGSNSITRQKLNITYVGQDLSNLWSITDIEIDNDSFDYTSNNVWMKLGDNYDTVVSLPIGHQRIRIISTNSDCLKTTPIDLNIKTIHRKSTFKVSIRQAEHYKQGRVLLAGDSAHCHSPVGGKGMNLGIDDAIAAAESIIQNTTEHYSQERHKKGRRVIKQTESIRAIIMNKHPVQKRIVRFVFRVINRISFLQKIMMKNISKL